MKIFFLIHEDTDLNFRMQLAGWKVLFVPHAIVYHRISQSIGHLSDLAIYYSLRNLEFVRIKNISTKLLVKHLPTLMIGSFAEFIYFGIRHRKLKIYLKAKLDVLKNWHQMYSKRKKILRNKKVEDEYIEKILTPVWDTKFLMEKLQKLIFFCLKKI